MVWLQRANLYLKIKPPLDPDFLPSSVWSRVFRQQLANSDSKVVRVALEREAGSLLSFELAIVGSSAKEVKEANLFYVERTIKTLLWMRGGWRLYLSGPDEIVQPLSRIYSSQGERAFDVDLMSKAYRQSFEVVIIDQIEEFPSSKEKTRPLVGQVEGYRIGFESWRK